MNVCSWLVLIIVLKFYTNYNKVNIMDALNSDISYYSANIFLNDLLFVKQIAINCKVNTYLYNTFEIYLY